MRVESVSFAENLKKLRRACGLTQKQVAAQLNVTFQAVSKWETGRAAPDIFVLPALAELLGCRVDDLFS
jgi:transcriptional regulator with XRE-family HTH domain